MKNYDLLVVGGGTAGCAAAYTAGKLGLKTLLIEKNIHLGGTITSGLVVPVMKSGENQINTDFFNALIAELQTIGAQVTYQNNPGWFNPELTKIALDSLMEKANVDMLFDCSINSVTLTDNKIESVCINHDLLSVSNLSIEDKEMLSLPIETRYVIDTTGDCEIGKICGCNFLEEKNQPASLRFIMDGIDVKRFGEWLLAFDTDRETTTVEVIDGVTHLSTAYTWDNNKKWALAPLFNEAVERNILKDSDRNYFQVFTIAGMPHAIAFNCPRIVNLEHNTPSKSLIEARKSILRLANFCKTYLPGFENAYISNIADMLGVRVSRRIRGKYVYTIDDLKSGKTFKNPVLISNYPVDVHSNERDKSSLDIVKDYQLPVESLISEDIHNLFVAGRCLSADFMAQGALRVQASCFSMGEGVAKHIAKLSGINLSC